MPFQEPVARLRTRRARTLRQQRRDARELGELRHELQTELAARTRLAASRAHYRDCYHEAPDMFVTVDLASGAIIECNATFAATVGGTRDTLLGRPLRDTAAPGAAGDLDRLLQQLRADETGRTVSCRLARRGADPIDASVTASVARDDRGRASGRLVMRDMSERRQLEQQLLQAQKMEGLVGWPAASRTISTTCSPPSLASRR